MPENLSVSPPEVSGRRGVEAVPVRNEKQALYDTIWHHKTSQVLQLPLFLQCKNMIDYGMKHIRMVIVA